MALTWDLNGTIMVLTWDLEGTMTALDLGQAGSWETRAPRVKDHGRSRASLVRYPDI